MTLTATMRPQLRWPCDFGFVPQTREDDGDPIDVALLRTYPSDGDASVSLTGWKSAADAYAAVQASHERWRGVSAQK